MSKIDLEKALTFVQKTSNKGVINSFILFVIVFFPSWMVITLFRSVMVQKESGAIVWGSMGIDAFFSTTGISLSVIIAFFLFLSLNGTVKEILKNFVYGKPMKLRIKEILMITGGVAGGIFLYDMTVTSLFFRDAPERLQSAIGLLSFSFPVAIVIAIVAAV